MPLLEKLQRTKTLPALLPAPTTQLLLWAKGVMTELAASPSGSFWADEKSSGLLERKWGHGEVILWHQERKLLAIDVCEKESFSSLKIACGKKIHPEHLSTSQPCFLFFSFLPFWPWMPGKKCFVPSWLFASPGWPCPRPWRLQVTHRLSLAPEDTRLTVFL